MPVHIIHGDCIGQLFYLSMEQSGEDALECLCKLLETAGRAWSQRFLPLFQKKLMLVEVLIFFSKSPLFTASLDKNETDAAKMTSYLEKLGQIARRAGLTSRIKFMILDVIDLRKAKYVEGRIWEKRKTARQNRCVVKSTL